MQSEIEQIEAAGIQLAAISYDDVPVLKGFSDRRSITIPLLSDAQSGKRSQTIRDYQLLDTRERGKYQGVPVPTTVVIDRERVVRLVLQGSIKKRHNIDELLRKVSALEP